ncbi:MAG: CGNR zinc finger domain-containing protein [Anaerolineae bacterium]
MVDLHEFIYQIFPATVEGQHLRPTDLAQFNIRLRDTLRRSEIVMDQGKWYGWSWQQAPLPLITINWQIIRPAADLLTAPELRFVEQCAADDCGWLFLDTSRNHNRRWSDVATAAIVLKPFAIMPVLRSKNRNREHSHMLPYGTASNSRKVYSTG